MTSACVGVDDAALRRALAVECARLVDAAAAGTTRRPIAVALRRADIERAASLPARGPQHAVRYVVGSQVRWTVLACRALLRHGSQVLRSFLAGQGMASVSIHSHPGQAAQPGRSGKRQRVVGWP